MAPKAKKSDGGGKSKVQEEEREEPLQAVVRKSPIPLLKMVYTDRS